jgi:hypothetical protein
MRWERFLEQPRAAEHAVLVYGALDELAESVGRYLDAGLASGDPAVLIATPGHLAAFEAELASRGRDLAGLRADGLLTTRDADETLAAFMDGGHPSPERFETVVGGLVAEVAARFPGRTIRAFGEMVDVLSAKGEKRAAMALEQLWNGLAETRDFALLCGYHLDVFDPAVQAQVLPAVFGAHTHARPVADVSRLTSAVDQALTEIVGPLEAARIYLDVAEQVPRSSVPRTQAVLMWLSAEKTAIAERVLERARSHYARGRELRIAALAHRR